MANELVEFPNGEYGMAQNLNEETVSVVILGSDSGIKEGDIVRRTGRVVSVPVGDQLIGRVVNALGQPIDGKGAIANEGFRPIENSAGVICTLLFVIFLKEEISALTWTAIVVITVGVLGVSFLENRGETVRKKKYGKTLAAIAFCMPFVYALLDAFGTFLDDAFFLCEDIASSPLVDVTEETIEAVANTSYELTFALFALGLFIFMKAKKVKFGPIPQHKDKIMAAVFETAGQFTYVYALGTADAIAAPILSSVCVVSLLLSRIFLKEKLSWKTYAFIAVVIIGILLLAVAEEL